MDGVPNVVANIQWTSVVSEIRWRRRITDDDHDDNDDNDEGEEEDDDDDDDDDDDNDNDDDNDDDMLSILHLTTICLCNSYLIGIAM